MDFEFRVNQRHTDDAEFPERRGLTILELLVTMAVLSALLALALPALATAREAARRVECTNHLRQIGLALHNYNDVHRSLPPAWRGASTRRSAFGWGSRLLPFVEQPALGSLIDQSGCLSNDSAQEARETTLRVFLCPSDTAPRLFTIPDSSNGVDTLAVATASYVGVYGTTEPDDIRPTPPGDGTFINDRPVRFAEIERGLSNTLVVGERSVSMFHSTWIGFDRRDADAECRILGAAIEGPNCRECDECEFSSRHPGVTAFLFGDGHVRGLPDSIDQKTYQQMARRVE